MSVRVAYLRKEELNNADLRPREERRKEIARQIEEFQKKGGVITEVPIGVSGQKIKPFSLRQKKARI